MLAGLGRSLLLSELDSRNMYMYILMRSCRISLPHHLGSLQFAKEYLSGGTYKLRVHTVSHIFPTKYLRGWSNNKQRRRHLVIELSQDPKGQQNLLAVRKGNRCQLNVRYFLSNLGGSCLYEVCCGEGSFCQSVLDITGVSWDQTPEILVVHAALGGVTISSYINKEVMIHTPRNTNTVVQLSSVVNFLSDRPTIGHKSRFCGFGGGGGVIKESKSRSNQTSREK